MTYCGLSRDACLIRPFRSVSDVIVFTITPVTLPASEFHDTRSPRRNLRPMGFLPEQAARIHRPLPLTFPLPVRNVLAGRAAGLGKSCADRTGGRISTPPSVSGQERHHRLRDPPAPF